MKQNQKMLRILKEIWVWSKVAFILGLVVVAHESGHFAAAKYCGVAVKTFALGMGPTVFSVAKGETDYAIKILPIGGGVQLYSWQVAEAMSSDELAALEKERPLAASAYKDSSRLMAYQPRSTQILVSLAGPVASLVLGWMLIVFSGAVFFGRLCWSGLDRVKEIHDPIHSETGSPTVGGFVHSFSADLLEVDCTGHRPTKITFSCIEADASNAWLRGERSYTTYAQVCSRLAHCAKLVVVKVSFWESMVFVMSRAFQAMIFALTFLPLWLGRKISGRTVADDANVQLLTPADLLRIIRESFLLDTANGVRIAGLLSFQLAVFNLWPIPALDGFSIYFWLLSPLFEPVDYLFLTRAENIGAMALMLLLCLVMLYKVMVSPKR